MSRRPTVLLLITTFDVGGAERVLIPLANGLAARGIRVIVACLQRRSGAVARELSPTVEAVDLGMSAKWDIAVMSRMVRLLRRERVDVLYTFLLHPSILGRVAARLAGTPVVLSSQQVMEWDGVAARYANMVTARLCTRVVAVSEQVADYLVRAVRVPPTRVVTIPNSVDVRRFSPQDANPPDRGVVGMVARLNPEKDHKTLIDAFALLGASHPSARLVLAGAGPERDAITAQVRVRHLEESVTLLGHQADVRAVLGKLDVYVQASHVEGLPVAVLEAMAMGLPVVATRVGGNPDAVEEGVTGLLVPPRDPRALASALSSLLADRSRRLRLGAAGRARVTALFSDEAMVEATDRLLRSLLDESRPLAS